MITLILPHSNLVFGLGAVYMSHFVTIRTLIVLVSSGLTTGNQQTDPKITNATLNSFGGHET